MKKLILGLLLISFGLSFILISAESQTNFETILSEDLERVQSDFFQETALWANNGEIIEHNQNKVLEFTSLDSSDSWTVFGGTTTDDLLISDGNFKTDFNFTTSGLTKLVVKVEDASTDKVIKQINIDTINNQIVDENNNPINDDEITFEEQTSMYYLSFLFDVDYSDECYIVFEGYTSSVSAKLIIDNFKLHKEVEEIQYKTIEESNFDNSVGEVHSSSIFWLNDDEATTAGFLENGNAIEGKSLFYQVNKVGWDILGGSKGDKLTIKGGHHYKISADIKMVDINYLSFKIVTISTPETVLYDMYINNQGQRIPGQTQISNPEYITSNNGVTHFEFVLDSAIEHNSYIVLHASSEKSGAQVILDNLVIEEEVVELPYETYTSDYLEDFDLVTTTTLPDFTFGDQITSSISSDIIEGQSLTMQTSSVFSWVDFVKTNPLNINIANDKYKVFLSIKASDIGQVKIELIDSLDDKKIHEYYFDVEKMYRLEGVGVEYKDYGKLVYKDGIFDIQFEFPSLEDDHNYYINVSGYSLSNSASISIDNFEILKAVESIIHDEEITSFPINTSDHSNLVRGIGGSDFYHNAEPHNLGTYLLIGGIILVGVVMIPVIIKVIPNRRKMLIATSTIITIALSGVIGITQLSYERDYEGAMENNNMEDYNIVYPEKISGHLQNPGMGWVSLEEPTYGGHPDLGTSGLLPEVDNISLSTSWALIETKEGVYDWSLLDKVVDYYTDLGKHINLRITTDNLMLPNTYKAVPDWLLDKYHIPYQMLNYTDGGPVQVMKVIDITNQDYLHHLGLFLQALSTHYSENDFVDVVEIRGFGNWGEWHSGYNYQTDEMRMSALQDIIKEFEDKFTENGKLIVLSAAWDPYYMPYDSYQQYIEVSAFDYLFKETGETFRRDSGGNLLNYYTDERLLSDAFRSGKRVPLLGEYASSIDAAINSQFGFDIEAGIDDILFKMRPNYSTVLGWVNQNVEWLVTNGYEELFDRGNEKLGYRLAVDMARYPKTVEANQEFTLLTSFSNSAVGRFWYEDKLKVSFLDEENNEVYSYINESFDARTFVLGEINNVYTNITLPESIANGNYKIAVSIVDNDNEPHIKLGMAGELEQSKMYHLGNITVANQASATRYAKQLSYVEATKYDFEKNQSYIITFEYTPHFDISEYEFGSNDGYLALLQTKDGGVSNTVGYTRWQDVSNEQGQKTIIVTTGDYDDYKFMIASDGFGGIDVDKVYIERVNAYNEHFEGYDFTELDSLFLPNNLDNVYFSDTENTIGNNTSVIIDSPYSGDYNGLVTDSNVYSFDENTTYTISFDFQNQSIVGKGGYMYLELIEGDSHTRIGEFYERDDLHVTTKTFTFTTGSSPKISIAFGMHNGGIYAIDNIQIIKQAEGQNISGENIINEHNTKPVHEFSTFGDTEGFESMSFIDNAFDWGYFGWGQFTYDEEYVISGNASLMGSIEQEAHHNEWFEFAKTKHEAYPFEANKSYHIEFDYKILENPDNDGRFYFLLRSDTGGITSDKGFTQLPVVESQQIIKYSQ